MTTVKFKYVQGVVAAAAVGTAATYVQVNAVRQVPVVYRWSLRRQAALRDVGGEGWGTKSRVGRPAE